MKAKISALMITKNCEETVKKSLESVSGWASEIVVIDDNSTDNTIKIVQNSKLKAQNYSLKLKVIQNKEKDLGRQRAYGLEKCTHNWVLVLDSDEVVTKELKKEIVTLLNGYIAADGYLLPFQTYYLGRKLKYGGENYKKLVFFQKNKAVIKSGLVNERFIIPSGKVGTLKNKIHHYSYRSLSQMYRKFTDYAFRDAKDKVKIKEKTSLKKIFIYPLHMFWARFIKDKGYKDGLFRIPLDLGFAYMEFLTYISMLFIK